MAQTAHDHTAGNGGLLSAGYYPSSGWIEVSETWAYASASTITIPSDGTLKYQKGIKIRLKQGGAYKYFVGTTIAATLITVAVNTDYVVANSAITDIAYSMIESPFGWPDWFNFTPVVSALAPMTFTLGGTDFAKYRISGKTVQLSIQLYGTTGGTASSRIYVAAPVAALNAASNGNPLVANIYDAATLGGFSWVNSTNLIVTGKYNDAVFGIGANRYVDITGSYPMA